MTAFAMHARVLPTSPHIVGIHGSSCDGLWCGRASQLEFGDVVGELAMFEDGAFSYPTPGRKRTATVHVIEHSELFTIHRDQVCI